MNYILTWLSGGTGLYPVKREFYISHAESMGVIEIVSTEKVGEAKVYRRYIDAEAVKYVLNKTSFMGAAQIESLTDKELFMFRLKGE